MRLPLAVLAAALLCAALPARAQWAPQKCRDLLPDTLTAAEFDAALPAYERCRRDFIAVTPIERRAAAGDEVVRAWIDRGERSLSMFIEYRRDKGGRAWLEVKILDEEKSASTKALPAEAFAAVQARWNARAAYEAEDQANEELAGKSAAGIETVCIPSWGAEVETARGDGATSSTALDSCKPWEFAFAHFLIARALDDCGCAEKFRDGSDDARLAACVMRR